MMDSDTEQKYAGFQRNEKDDNTEELDSDDVEAMFSSAQPRELNVACMFCRISKVA